MCNGNLSWKKKKKKKRMRGTSDKDQKEAILPYCPGEGNMKVLMVRDTQIL